MAILTIELLVGFFACLGAFLAGLYLYMTRNFKYWKRMGIKQMEPSFPFGNFGQCMLLKQSIHELNAEAYAEGEGEKMIGFYVLDRPYLLLRDPDLLRCVFIKDFNLFANKLMCNNSSDPFGTHMLFLEASPPWRYIRHKMSPMFTSGKLKKNFDLMMEIYEDLDFYLKHLGVNDKTAKTVEIRETCGKLMSDVIGIHAYNIRFNSLRDPEAPFRKYGKSMVRSGFMRYLQFTSILYAPALRPIALKPRFFDIGTEFFQNTFSRIAEERIKSGVKKGDFVDLVIDMINNEENDSSGDFKVGHDSWMSQLAGMFSAGFETSSTTTSFALYHLATEAEIQKRLRDELFEAMQQTNGKLTYDIVMNAPYLNMVTRETLRIYPILTWVDRTADVDYTFPGTNVTIQKGTPVIFPIRAMQIDRRYFPNPQKFDPERFSDANKGEIVPFTYAPFGEGPRNCIGGRLGLLQVKLALAYLITNYELSSCDSTPVSLQTDKMNIFTHPSGEINVNFKKIS